MNPHIFWPNTEMVVIVLLLIGVSLLLVRTIFRSRVRPQKPQVQPNRPAGRAGPPLRSQPDLPSESLPLHSLPPPRETRSLEDTEKKELLGQVSVNGSNGTGQKLMPQRIQAAVNGSNGTGQQLMPQKAQAAVETLWSDLKRERTARFVSFINFKGGVGKSTCAVEIATSLAKHFGKRVLLIDLDPQTNATFYLMDHSEWESWQQTNGSLKTLFDAYLAGSGESFDVSRVIKKDLLCHGGKSQVPGLELLPSHLALILIDIQLAAKATVGEAVFSSQAVIRQALQQVQDQYDYIIFDCPPNFNLVTQNGLFASDSYVIPAIPDYLSTLGISLIQGEVHRFSKRIRTALAMFGGSFIGPELSGIIFTRVRLRSRKPLRFIDLHERRIHEVYQTNPELAFKNFISEGVRFAEAPERQMPVSVSPRVEDREARNEFMRLTEEFIARIEGKENHRGTDEHPLPRADAGDPLSDLTRTSGGRPAHPDPGTAHRPREAKAELQVTPDSNPSPSSV
jgi:chromosome partitioning protein